MRLFIELNVNGVRIQLNCLRGGSPYVLLISSRSLAETSSRCPALASVSAAPLAPLLFVGHLRILLTGTFLSVSSQPPDALDVTIPTFPPRREGGRPRVGVTLTCRIRIRESFGRMLVLTAVRSLLSAKQRLASTGCPLLGVTSRIPYGAPLSQPVAVAFPCRGRQFQCLLPWGSLGRPLRAGGRLMAHSDTSPGVSWLPVAPR